VRGRLEEFVGIHVCVYVCVVKTGNKTNKINKDKEVEEGEKRCRFIYIKVYYINKVIQIGDKQ
jgi:hypothetical protein